MSRLELHTLLKVFAWVNICVVQSHALFHVCGKLKTCRRCAEVANCTGCHDD